MSKEIEKAVDEVLNGQLTTHQRIAQDIWALRDSGVDITDAYERLIQKWKLEIRPSELYDMVHTLWGESNKTLQGRSSHSVAKGL